LTPKRRNASLGTGVRCFCWGRSGRAPVALYDHGTRYESEVGPQNGGTGQSETCFC
jgi:hypothetical protein